MNIGTGDSFRTTLALAVVYNAVFTIYSFRILQMLSIRPATINDAALLSGMIHELAEFEHLAHEASVSEEIIARDGFGPNLNFAH